MPKRTTRTRGPFTSEILGEILAEEFDRDHWGDIDPYLFRPRPEDWKEHDQADDWAAMYEVLARVCGRLNKLVDV